MFDNKLSCCNNELCLNHKQHPTELQKYYFFQTGFPKHSTLLPLVRLLDKPAPFQATGWASVLLSGRLRIWDTQTKSNALKVPQCLHFWGNQLTVGLVSVVSAYMIVQYTFETPCMLSHHFCLYNVIGEYIIFQSEIIVTWVQKRHYILHITKTRVKQLALHFSFKTYKKHSKTRHQNDAICRNYFLVFMTIAAIIIVKSLSMGIFFSEILFAANYFPEQSRFWLTERWQLSWLNWVCFSVLLLYVVVRVF